MKGLTFQMKSRNRLDLHSKLPFSFKGNLITLELRNIPFFLLGQEYTFPSLEYSIYPFARFTHS